MVNVTLLLKYTGPGALSRALLHLKDNEVKKLIILEPWKDYLPWVKVRFELPLLSQHVT